MGLGAPSQRTGERRATADDTDPPLTVAPFTGLVSPIAGRGTPNGLGVVGFRLGATLSFRWS